MKNTILWLCRFVAVCIFVYGCSREDMPPPNSEQAGITLQQVRQLYSDIAQMPGLPSFFVDYLSVTNSVLTPDWGKAVKTQEGNVARFEIPLNAGTNYLSLIAKKTGTVTFSLVIEVNEQAGLMRQFVATFLSTEQFSEINYSSDKSYYRGLMILSAPHGEFLKGFLYDKNGRTNISLGGVSSDQPITTLRICESPVLTRSEGGDNKPTSYEYCNDCCSVQPFYGSRCMTCSLWEERLDEIIVTPDCPEHGRGCTICNKFCKKCYRYNCNCDPDDPYYRPGPPPSGESGGGGNGNNNGNYPALCPECGACNCPGRYGQQCENFPPMGGHGAPGSTQDNPLLSFKFVDENSRAKVAGVIMQINSRASGARLLEILKDWNILIEYQKDSPYVASYVAKTRTLTWKDSAHPLDIFHELVHAMHHAKGINYVSNAMNREVEAFMGEYLWAKELEILDDMPGDRAKWEEYAEAYLTNSTDANYFKIVGYIQSFHETYKTFSENEKYRNIDNLHFLFNGN